MSENIRDRENTVTLHFNTIFPAQTRLDAPKHTHTRKNSRAHRQAGRVRHWDFIRFGYLMHDGMLEFHG